MTSSGRIKQGFGPLLLVQLNPDFSVKASHIIHPAMRPQSFKALGLNTFFAPMGLLPSENLHRYITDNLYASTAYRINSKTKTDTLALLNTKKDIERPNVKKPYKSIDKDFLLFGTKPLSATIKPFTIFLLNNAYLRLRKS